jgi:hypothetical protein
MTTSAFDFTRLCQRHAARPGVQESRDPDNYPHHADVVGLTIDALGPDRCARLFHALRRHARSLTDGDCALSVLRDPVTHERVGYRVHARDAATATSAAAYAQRLGLS